MYQKIRKERGITLVVLVITILILVILVGVTIVTLKHTNLFDNSSKGKDINENNKQSALDLIEVGDEIKYIPNEDSKFAIPTYFGVIHDSVEPLSTESLTWKVWKKTKDDILIAPTTPTTATLKLTDADGYNNAVQALNAYCKKYYSDTANGIIARNINIDDLESSMTEAGKTARDEYKNEDNNEYGKIGNPSTKSNYPGLYASEEPKTKDSLGLSNSPNKKNIYAEFIGDSSKSDGEKVYSSGYKQTLYYFSNSDLTNNKYYDDITLDLLFSKTGYGSGFWVASRCVDVYSDSACFNMREVTSDGDLNCWYMFFSDGDDPFITATLALRPVVTIPASKISAYVK